MKLSVDGGKLLTQDGPGKPRLADDEAGKGKEKDPAAPKLGFKDYLALSIAALETFLLPLLVIAAVIALLAVVFALRP
jgi:hypothetical protein